MSSSGSYGRCRLWKSWFTRRWRTRLLDGWEKRSDYQIQTMPNIYQHWPQFLNILPSFCIKARSWLAVGVSIRHRKLRAGYSDLFSKAKQLDFLPFLKPKPSPQWVETDTIHALVIYSWRKRKTPFLFLNSWNRNSSKRGQEQLAENLLHQVEKSFWLGEGQLHRATPSQIPSRRIGGFYRPSPDPPI